MPISDNNVQWKVTKVTSKGGSTVPMTGASSSAAGSSGVVPTPNAGDQEKFLRGDGTWATPTVTGSTDTKVTNTLATTTKAYVTGTTSSSTNTGTQVFDTGVYLDTTAGKLTAGTLNAATINATTTLNIPGGSIWIAQENVMAELNKKLNLQKSGSSAVTCKIYSTADEAGDTYMRCTADGVNGYIALGNTSDANATVGRVSKGGTTYAIKSQAKPAYAEVPYTTAGTYTFTVPAGVTRIRVAVCGGGGGARAYYTNKTGSNPGNATSGGTSSLGSLISATGGAGASYSKSSYSGDHFTTYYYTPTAGAGGSPNGKQGNYSATATTIARALGWSLGFSASIGDYGSSGYGTQVSANPLASGGGGGYNTGYFDVASGTSYTVTVGAAGANCTATGDTYYDAFSGFVLIAYGGDI